MSINVNLLLRRLIDAKGANFLRGLILKDFLKEGEWCYIQQVEMHPNTFELRGPSFSHYLPKDWNGPRLSGTFMDKKEMKKVAMVSLRDVPENQKEYVQSAFVQKMMPVLVAGDPITVNQ